MSIAKENRELRFSLDAEFPGLSRGKKTIKTIKL